MALKFIFLWFFLKFLSKVYSTEKSFETVITHSEINKKIHLKIDLELHFYLKKSTIKKLKLCFTNFYKIMKTKISDIEKEFTKKLTRKIMKHFHVYNEQMEKHFLNIKSFYNVGIMLQIDFEDHIGLSKLPRTLNNRIDINFLQKQYQNSILDVFKNILTIKNYFFAAAYHHLINDITNIFLSSLLSVNNTSYESYINNIDFEKIISVSNYNISNLDIKKNILNCYKSLSDFFDILHTKFSENIIGSNYQSTIDKYIIMMANERKHHMMQLEKLYNDVLVDVMDISEQFEHLATAKNILHIINQYFLFIASKYVIIK